VASTPKGTRRQQGGNGSEEEGTRDERRGRYRKTKEDKRKIARAKKKEGKNIASKGRGLT